MWLDHISRGLGVPHSGEFCGTTTKLEQPQIQGVGFNPGLSMHIEK